MGRWRNRERIFLVVNVICEGILLDVYIYILYSYCVVLYV